jgi:Trk-type K+ transport systems, membrane components
VSIEVVLTIFQLLAAINFATHFVALKKHNFNPYIDDREARAFLTLIISSCLFTAWLLWDEGTYPDYLTALRYASFNLVTIATDCGFSNQDFNKWPIFVPMWMLFFKLRVSFIRVYGRRYSNDSNYYFDETG